MTITTADGLINAMANNATRIIIDKPNFANTSVGNYFSYWRIAGQPGQAVLPTATVECPDNTYVGSINFLDQTSPTTSYLGILELSAPTASTTLEIHDRILQRGGLLGNTTGVQTASADLAALTGSNLPARIGDANYSDVQWWLEWYTDTGATASNAQITVTYNDSTTGTLNAVAVGGTVRAGRMISLNNLIPVVDAGKYIASVNTVQLTAGTGAAGNFGITATRYRGSVFTPVANARLTANYINLGLPEIHNGSCLFPVVIANATTIAYLKATGKIIHG